MCFSRFFVLVFREMPAHRGVRCPVKWALVCSESRPCFTTSSLSAPEIYAEVRLLNILFGIGLARRDIRPRFALLVSALWLDIMRTKWPWPSWPSKGFPWKRIVPDKFGRSTRGGLILFLSWIITISNMCSKWIRLRVGNLFCWVIGASAKCPIHIGGVTPRIARHMR